MHPLEVEKQRRYRWWLDLFTPPLLRQGNRDERYRVGILVVAMLASLLFSLPIVVQSLSLPVSTGSRLAASCIPLASVLVLLILRRFGNYRDLAFFYGILIVPLVLIHALSLRTVYIGYFYWIPWITVFVGFMTGRRSSLLVGTLALLQGIIVLRSSGAFGQSLGVFPNFSKLFLHLTEHQIFAQLSITLTMFTFSLYNDRMESELERQHVSRAHSAHKAMIGEMLGNLAHEVNNPLAIVHTALIHYQRLLTSQRLDQSMKRGLIQRIEDALDRLNLVVRDLNSSADWSELELPRSDASVQSGSERPLQFSSSPLMAAGLGPEMPDRRRHRRWIHRSTRQAVKVLDSLMPEVTRSWSTTQRFRARSTALIYSIGFVAICFDIVQLFREQARGAVMGIGFVFLAISVLFLILQKIWPKPQILGVAYIACLYVANVILAAYSAQSVLVPTMLWFPAIIMALFLVTRPRLALIMSLGFIVGDGLLMNHLAKYGLRSPFSMTFSEYLARTNSVLVLSNVTTMIVVASFLSLMNTTKGLLVSEKHWQLLSARMRELSELADSAAILIGEPLTRLEKLLQRLLRDGQREDDLKAMLHEVDSITRVSQSFALLSRPKANEALQTMEGHLWLLHIRHICFRRAEEAHWTLQCTLDPKDVSITGPMGQLTMLVIACLKEAFVQKAPTPLSALKLHLELKEGFGLNCGKLWPKLSRNNKSWKRPCAFPFCKSYWNHCTALCSAASLMTKWSS